MKTNTITKALTIFFFTVSILDIVGLAFNNSLLRTIFKPLIVLSLMALYYFSSNKKNHWYLVALLFSFFGDVLLMDKNNLFLFGIAAFLVTQIIYIYIILKQLKKPSFFHKYLYAFLFVNYAVYLLSLLKPNLGELFYPVLVYGITISVFGLVATLNYVTKRTTATFFLMLGAILFVASDSMIALHKFHEPKSFYPITIMITYVLAQYLIYQFIIKEEITLKELS